MSEVSDQDAQTYADASAEENDYESEHKEHPYGDMSTDEDDYESPEDATEDLLDLEALEGESDSGAESDLETDDEVEPWLFPQFQRLPNELRSLIWEAFCPDLTTKARVFEVTVSDPEGVCESAMLGQQTKPARTVLAINRYSRAQALKIFPDSFQIRRGLGVIRFNREKDVVVLSGQVFVANDVEELFELLGDLSDVVRNLALDNSTPSIPDSDYQEAIELLQQAALFPELKALHILLDAHDYLANGIGWVVSDSVQHYHFQVFEQEPGLGENYQARYCWPELEKHRAFAEAEITKENYFSSMHLVSLCRELLADSEGLEEVLGEFEVADGLEIWPMVRFMFDSGIEDFDRMKTWDKPWDDFDDPDSDSGSDSESEYDSEGIDDGPIELYTSSDDDDDLAVQPLSDDISGFNGFSPDPNATHVNFSSAEPESPSGNDFPQAQFSSPEPESPVEDEGGDSRSDDEDEDEDNSVTATEEPARATGRRARALLADSDDEDDENSDADKAPSQSAPGVSRRARVVLSNSEDESEAGLKAPPPTRAARQRARALPTDSEDNDEDEDMEDGGGPAQPTEFDNSGDEDSDEKEEEVAPRRLSLAERLQLHREENPVELAGNDSNAEDMSGNDYWIEYQDNDDKTSDVSEQDEMIMGMAEESEVEGGDDESGW